MIQRRQAILDYWLKLEYFAPFDPTRDADEARVIGVLEDGDLPWMKPQFVSENPRPPRRSDDAARDGKRWALAHSAYIGCFRLSESAAAVQSALRDTEEPIEDAQGYGCFARLDLNEHGHWTGALTLASLPWAVGRVVTGQHRADDWDKDLATFTDRAAAAVPLPLQRPVTAQELRDAGTALHQLAGWVPKEPVPFSLILVWRWQLVETQSATAEDPRQPAARPNEDAPAADMDSDAPEILNGFFIPDLARIKAHVGGSDAGESLLSYLDPAQPDRRVDLSADADALRRAVSPGRLPEGRWPGADDQPLNLMQQAAVNLALSAPASDSADARVFAINGPPGTGKTTLLRDLVAGIITKRAEALAAIDHAERAFKRHDLPGGGRFASAIWEPPPSVVGHEIVPQAAAGDWLSADRPPAVPRTDVRLGKPDRLRRPHGAGDGKWTAGVRPSRQLLDTRRGTLRVETVGPGPMAGGALAGGAAHHGLEGRWPAAEPLRRFAVPGSLEGAEAEPRDPH